MNLAGLRAFLPDRRHAWIVAGYWVAFFSLEVLTIGFRQATGVNMWFPPPALTLALVLTFGKPVVWAAFLAHLPYGLIFRAPIIDIPTTILICLAHGVAYAGPALLARGRGLTGGLDRLRDLAGFLLLAALSSGLLALLIASILAARALGFAQFRPLLASLWLGDAVGLLCLAPFLLIWVAPALQGHRPDPNREFSPVRVVEALAQGLFLLVTSIVIMLHQQGQVFPMKYLALFPLLWIALRWGPRGAAAAVLGYGLVTTSAFIALGYPRSLLGDLQIFLAFLAPLTLLLGTLAEVRSRVERSLGEQSARLASILRATEERTALAELRASEANLQESLKEKDLAIREIHHRVKNNLQVVSSLLRLQALHSGNPEVIRALTEAQERIQAIALVHARLHQAPTLAKADLRDYLNRLVAQLVRSFASAPSLVEATVEVAELSLGPDDLVPLALVLHELVLNALRHGFPPGKGGSLFVALAMDAEGRVTLRVEDDGQGLPVGFDPLQEGSLGFQLIRALTDQLKGTFQTTRRRGAAFQLTFTPRSP